MSDIDLNSQEVKDAIEAAVNKATEGLIAKRDELLGEVRKLKQGRTINPEDVTKLEDKIDALQSQVEEANKAAKKAQGDAEKAAKAKADAEATVSKLLVDNGLSDALAKVGVTNPVLVKAAKAMFSTQAQVADEGGAKVAKLGDKLLADAITEWAGSDEGKHFVTAHDASGGGAQGNRNRGGAAAKSVTREAFNGMDPAQQANHFREGGIVTD